MRGRGPRLYDQAFFSPLSHRRNAHMTTSRRLLGAFGVAALLVLGTACSAEDQANQALKDANIDGDISLDGGIPKDFPSDEIATPDLSLQTGIGLQGTYTLKYTTKDAKADVATY